MDKQGKHWHVHDMDVVFIFFENRACYFVDIFNVHLFINMVI